MSAELTKMPKLAVAMKTMRPITLKKISTNEPYNDLLSKNLLLINELYTRIEWNKLNARDREKIPLENKANRT